MNLPVISVSIALSTDPLDPSPVWDVFSSRLVSANIRRGRQRSLGVFEAGTATIRLLNGDRLLDPTYTAGTYGSTVRPRKRVDLLVDWGGVVVSQPLYSGFIESIHPDWPQQAQAYVDLTVVDAFKLFNKRKLVKGKFSASVLANGSTRAYYRMNDDAGASVMTDSSANLHHGTYTGRNLVWGDGSYIPQSDDKSLNCGASDGAAVGPTGAGVSGQSLGVMMAINVPALPSAYSYTLFDQVIDGGTGRLVIQLLSDGKIRVTELANVYDTTDAIPAVDRWALITVIRTPTEIRVSINDNAANIDSVSAVTYTQDAPHFGEQYDGSRFFDGFIDEVVTFATTDANLLPSAEDVAGLYADLWEFNWGSGDTAWDRIEYMLDYIGWPAGDRNVIAGGYPLHPDTRPVDTTFLAYMQKHASETEGGLFFMTADGKVYYRAEASLTPPSSSWTAGDGAGEVPYHQAPAVEYTDRDIINNGTLSGQGFPTIFFRDQTSITEFEASDAFQQNDLLFADAGDARDRADRILAAWANPKVRVGSITLSAIDSPADTIPAMLETELGDTITVKRRPPGGGSAMSILCQVTGISHDIGPEHFLTTFHLEPW